MARASNLTPRVALYLDTWLSRELMAHVLEQCRDLGASLLCLAPPPGNLAVSRMEPHLGALDRAGIEWQMQAVDGELGAGLPDLPGITQLVCGSRSALAHHRGPLPVPLLILLNPEPVPARAKPEPERTIDWLAPRFNRGY